jgi:hypothetical protein
MKEILVCILWGVGAMYVIYVYIVDSRVLQIPDIFRAVGFMLRQMIGPLKPTAG